jgi:hypothetical protein
MSPESFVQNARGWCTPTASSSAKTSPAFFYQASCPSPGFDHSIRRDPLYLKKMESCSDLLITYPDAVRHAEKTRGINYRKWRSLRMEDLSPRHQGLVYKLCPDSPRMPTLGEVEMEDSSTRRIIFYMTEKASGYILL